MDNNMSPWFRLSIWESAKYYLNENIGWIEVIGRIAQEQSRWLKYIVEGQTLKLP